MYYDANPATQAQVQTLLSLNDLVLRETHLKARSKLDFITMQRPDKNPYVKRVLRMDAEKEKEQQQQKEEDENPQQQLPE